MSIKDAWKSDKSNWDPTHRFQTSWLLPPWALFCCRIIISIYAFTTLFYRFAYSCNKDVPRCENARESFSFFTNLTFWGIAFYHLVAAVHTLTYILRGRPLLDRFPRILRAAHSLFYTTVVTFPFIVTIVYWAIIYEAPWYARTYSAWNNITVHGLNSAFALFEIFVTRTAPPPWIHIPWELLIMMGYLGVAYITVATQGFYPYAFLDYREVNGRGYVAAYCVGIAVACVVVFTVVWCLVWLRRWVTETKLGFGGKFAKRAVTRANTVEMGRSTSY